MKNWFFFLLVLLLGACAGRHGAVSPEGTDERWQKMLTASAAAPHSPYRLQMSLRFGVEGDTRRVTALFWGNGNGALRLDVMAGIGAVAANILEDGQHFLLYVPRDNKAYFYQGAARPLLNAGVPIPFTLRHLADMLNGRYAPVFGAAYSGSANTTARGTRYPITGGPGGDIVLNADGLPVSWRENGDKAWTMEIDYDDGTPPLPQRLALTHSNGNRAILLIKEREPLAVAFSPDQLHLALPENAPLLPLARYKK